MVNEFVWITALGAAAIVAGAFMLRGHNWARWLALAWIAAHVVISALNLMQGLLIHCVMLLAARHYSVPAREAREYFKTG